MFKIDRADMKLLTECGYSAILRNTDVEPQPIFDALTEWMPEQGAGPIGTAMRQMVQGNFAEADDTLSALIASEKTGRNEARAILAMVRKLRKDDLSAEKLARDLEGQGGPAEGFARLLTSGEAQSSRGDQGPAKETVD